MANYSNLEHKLSELQSMQYAIYQKVQELAEHSNRLQNLANKHSLMWHFVFLICRFLANQEPATEPSTSNIGSAPAIEENN